MSGMGADVISGSEPMDEEYSIKQRFEVAVLLIASGLVEKESLYEKDPHSYPYSGAFRHGLCVLAALHAECASDAAAAVAQLDESSFIRRYASAAVQEWVSSWRPECLAMLESSEVYRLGPLAVVSSGFFSATSECYEVLRFAEPDLIGAHQEREVYTFLRNSGQERYVLGRLLLVRYPVLAWDNYAQLRTGRFDFSADPLNKGEAADVAWTKELLSLSYEQVEGPYKYCPTCGWTMHRRGLQPYCSSPHCSEVLVSDFSALPDVEHDAFRLRRGVMRYISAPGGLELKIAELAKGLGLGFKLWPRLDTCDVSIVLPDGRLLAVDAKAYSNPFSLARAVRDDGPIASLGADCVVYVVPDYLRKSQPAICDVCNSALSDKPGHKCMFYGTFTSQLKALVRGCD